MADLILYGPALSTYVRVVRMGAAERGVELKMERTFLGPGDARDLHPFSRLPVLRHGDFEVYETLGIITYLEEAFPGPALLPKEAKAKALALQWISAINAYIDPVFVRRYILGHYLPVLQGQPPNQAQMEAAIPDLRHHLAVLEKNLAKGQPYFVGASLTWADLFAFPIFYYLARTPGPTFLDEAPALKAWLARMEARESAKTTEPSM